MCESTIVWLTPSNIYPTYITKFERKKGKLSSVHNTWKKHDKFLQFLQLKFMFSKKATKIDEIFTVDLTLCSKCQIDGEDFFNFFGLLRKHEL